MTQDKWKLWVSSLKSWVKSTSSGTWCFEESKRNSTVFQMEWIDCSSWISCSVVDTFLWETYGLCVYQKQTDTLFLKQRNENIYITFSEENKMKNLLKKQTNKQANIKQLRNNSPDISSVYHRNLTSLQAPGNST